MSAITISQALDLIVELSNEKMEQNHKEYIFDALYKAKHTVEISNEYLLGKREYSEVVNKLKECIALIEQNQKKQIYFLLKEERVLQDPLLYIE